MSLDFILGALVAILLMLLAREVIVTVKPFIPPTHVGRHRKEI